ncbi:MAG: secondary thiamine-phosphate synthase enzyme YjbQ [Candidatus Electryonea clarkiae]|nr:secondary thiamine-phosphate synthase enzyme YjbQ [Candidatus Electryonea clarkiae]MDP8288577.1 secondary thiamine-phosphate synthase enzyme YjbQ [Candidatus Electryonea clarkiae]
MDNAKEEKKLVRRQTQMGGMAPPMAPAEPGVRVVTETIPVQTRGGGQMVDLTAEIGRVLQKIGMSDGTVTVFVSGSTASITTIEYEPGLQKDFPDAMERIAPSKGMRYKHDDTWHDGNGHSHVRASLVGPSLTIPFSQRRLMLGTWQQIVVNDWDNKGRYRDIILQFMGV